MRKHLWWVTGVRAWGNPGGLRAAEGVGEHEQLAQAGDERHLGRLAGGDEALGEGLDARVVAGGRQGGHVERVAHLGAAAPAAAPPAPGAAVAIEGGHPDQGGDLLAGAGAQFGHVGQPGGGGHGADARDALEPGGARAQGVRVMARDAGDVGLAGVEGRTGERDGGWWQGRQCSQCVRRRR